MMRGLYAVRLYPGTGVAFDRRHEEAKSDLLEEARQAGIRRTAGFRRETDAWFYVESDGPVDEAVRRCRDMPAHRELRHHLRDIVDERAGEAGPTFYREVFHTDRGPALDGPMSRGLLSLVIDPERSGDYDSLHAEPWPELIDALADSGFRNYSGFRRGPHVVYYGEYYPDMRTVFGRMATHEVDARWGEALGGVITTIRDQDGWLITADEVVHLQPDRSLVG